MVRSATSALLVLLAVAMATGSVEGGESSRASAPREQVFLELSGMG